jgi:aminomethyltransferase
MLGCGIGLGLVEPEAAAPGTELGIRHENVAMRATVCELPFYKGGSVRG